MKNPQFIFFRLSLYLIAGMLCAFYFSLSQKSILIFSLVAVLFFIIAYLRTKRQIFTDSVAGIASFFLIFATGLYTAHYSIPENQPAHYLQMRSGAGDIAQGTVTEELKPTAFTKRYVLELDKIISRAQVQKIQGKILLNIRIDSLTTTDLKTGNTVLLPWNPEKINTALNPFQFDYRGYMAGLRIERQLQTDISQIRIISQHKNGLLLLAGNFREKIIKELNQYDFSKNELAVFQALILGQRRDINDELYQKYAEAGAIHILAISGLHVGILLLFLNFLLKPMEKIRYGKYVKPLSVIILLWSFALITGLSASVVRAVCMFSFIAIGLQIKRKTATLNSLFLSLFFLLLVNPYYLFQVGFQLSYLAVFGIIVFQPLIYRLFIPDFKILDYFWKLISVSIAAQIAVLPLSLYYFHQFPGMFLITNIFVLPFLGFILICGLLVIILAYLGLLPGLLVKFFGGALYILNRFITEIAGIDAMVFTDIDFSSLQMLSAYLIILLFSILITNPNFKRLFLLLLSIVIFQAVTFYNKISIPSHEGVVFHKNRETLIGIKENHKLKLLSSQSAPPTLIKDYIRERQIEELKLNVIPEISEIANKLILIIDTAGNYNIKDFSPEFIILRNSPRINLERILDELEPKSIIADGSNYPSFIELWRRSCDDKKIPFHYTGEKGAHIFSE